MWTVTQLQPSRDSIPFQTAGTLWEATATASPVNGGVPVVPGFAARGGADDYPVLWPVPTALGVNPSALPAGGTATGKLYFDVVGPAPTSVVYSSNGHDTAVWVQPPPAPAGQPSAGSYPAPYSMGAAPAATPKVTAPAAPAATGSSGTPLPAASGSSGTPLPAENSATTPPPAGSSGTPASGSSGTPASGSSGTPATGTQAPAASSSPAASPAPTAAGPAATPNSPSAAPAPTTAAGSAGTPLTAPTTTVVPAG